jgi:hypothetical protein
MVFKREGGKEKKRQTKNEQRKRIYNGTLAFLLSLKPNVYEVFWNREGKSKN